MILVAKVQKNPAAELMVSCITCALSDISQEIIKSYTNHDFFKLALRSCLIFFFSKLQSKIVVCTVYYVRYTVQRCALHTVKRRYLVLPKFRVNISYYNSANHRQQLDKIISVNNVSRSHLETVKVYHQHTI